MFKVGTMLKAREVRLSRKKPPYHPALIPGTSFISLSDCARPAGGRFKPFSVTALQLRINCLAGSLKGGRYLGGGLSGLHEVVQFPLLVDGPWPPCRR